MSANKVWAAVRNLLKDELQDLREERLREGLDPSSKLAIDLKVSVLEYTLGLVS